MKDGIPENMNKEQLLLAITLGHVSMALAHLMNCNIRDNSNVNAATNLLHTIVRARCDSDEMFEDIMVIAGEHINHTDPVLN